MMPTILSLTQNSSYRKVARITHDLKRETPIWWLYDGRRNECLLEVIEGCIALFIKSERGFLGKKASERPGYLRKVFDETSIESGVA